MASGVGFVAVPVVPTFKGMSKEFSERLEKPARESGKRAGKAMTEGVESAVENLERQVHASSSKLKDLDRAYETSVTKRAAQQEKLEAATLRLQDAEENYQKALEKGDKGTVELAKVKDAKARVIGETEKLEQAEIDVRVAEEKHKNQLDDLNSTLGKLNDAQKENVNGSKESASAMREAGDAAGDAAAKSELLENWQLKVAAGFTALVGGAVAAGKALFDMGSQFDDAYDSIRVGTGASGQAFDDLKESMRNVATESIGVGSDMGAIGGTLADLNTRLGLTGEPLEKMTSQFLQLQNLGVDADINEVSKALNGFGIEAKDMPGALDELFQVSQATGLTITELSNSAVKAGPSLRGFGFSMADSAALVGQMDKAGLDADKTLQSMQRALSEFAAEGRDAPEALKETIGSIEDFINAGDEASAINMAAGIFGTRGAAQFVDAVKTGTLSVEDFMGATGATSDTIGGLAEETADFSERWDQFKNQVMVALEPVATELFKSLAPALDTVSEKFEFLAKWVTDSLIPAFKNFGEWVQKNSDWLTPLAVALGTFAGSVTAAVVAVKAWNGAMSLYKTVTKLATAETKLFNKTLKANAIFLVISAVVALAAGLVYFFSKTETGRELWDKFTSALADGWDWVVEKFSSGWSWLMENVFQPMSSFFMETLWPAIQSVMSFVSDAFSAVWDGLTWAWKNVIQPVFNGIWKLAQITLAVIATTILAPLMIAWNLLSTAIQWAWENVIQPIWQAIVTFAQKVLWPVLRGVVQWIGDSWQWLSDKFSMVWGWMRDNVLQPMVDFFQNTLWPAIQAVLGFINDAWQFMANAMGVVWTWLWDNIFAPFIDGLSNVASWFKARVDDMVAAWQWYQDLVHAGWKFIDNYVFAPLRAGLQIVADWFRARVDDMLAIWQGFQDLLHAGWRFIEDYVFNPIGKGLDSVQNWFRKGVDGIGRVWDGLRAVAARPVKFVIDTVWNNGILRAWNAIADFLPGIDTVNKIDLGQLGGYAQGGVLPGYTPGRDVHDFYSPTGGMIHLSGGEAIMRPEWTRAVGGKKTVDRLNAMAKAGKLDEDMMAIGLSHGTLGAFANGGVIGAMANIVRAKYPMLQLTSGYRPGDRGMHGAGLASDWSNGHGNTPQQLALAHDIARTYPGSAELIYDSPGWAGNIKNGRNVGPFGAFYTMAQAGPHHHHVHWAMTTAPTLQFGGGVFEGGNNGGPGGPGGGFFNWIADKAKGIWSDMVDPLKRRIEDIREDSKFWDIPFGFLETIKDKTWSFLSSKFGSGGGVGSGSVDISDVSGAVAKQVETVFARHGFTGADWEAAKWIIGKESGWSPTATNPSSGAYGLFQFNPMGGNTLAAYLPDRNPDPAVQADAGARYIKDRYGSPTAAKAFWERNGWYSSGGVVELPKLYDQGGWLEHGKAAFNLSGKPEPVFNAEQWRTLAAMIRSGASMGDVARELGRLVPALQDQANAFAKFADNAEEWLRRAGDYNSIEGINARQGIRRVLDLGLELPGTDAVKSILDAEKTLWDTRANAVSNLDTITEKEKALQEARRAVSELEEGPEGVSKKDQKKIDKAQKALDEAKKEQSKADSDKKRAKAAEKVAKAEEKLKEVREEVDDKTEESAKKHAEELVKANDAVTKAEKELAEARHKQAMDLDNVVLASQSQIQGLIPQAQQLASQLIGMGAPAQAVNAGLGGVVSVLGKVAGFAGPAGITLGMVLGVAKSVINVVKTVVKAIIELINKIRQARLEALKTLAEGWAVIAEYAKLVVDMQGKVTSLQQALIRGANAQREAEYNLKLAQHDRYIAEAEGSLKVAEARLALDAEIKRGATIAQLKMMGLHEDWDTYMAYQALQAQGVLEEWSDSAISALFTYEKARAEALKGEVTARLEQIKAEAALAEAQRQNVRNQQDLLRAQERLIRMSAKAAGVDLVEATGTAQVAKLMSEMAEVQQAMDKNVFGRWGVGLGANGSYANEYRGQQAQYESLKKALDAVLAETGVKVDQDRLDRTLKLMGKAAFRDGDVMSVLRSQLPELARAETALRVNEALKPVYEARDQRTDMERQVEDLAAEIDLYGKTTPLEHTLKGLDYTIRSLDHAAQAWKEGNEKMRGEYLRASRANSDAAAAAGVNWKLDPKYANAKLRERVEREVTIHMNGEEMYTANEVDQLLDQVLTGTDTRHRVVWTSSQVATSRRKERV